MSVTRQQSSSKTYDQKNFYPLTLLSLNDIFRESMRKIQQLFPRVKIIVRCESLPVIKGNQQDIFQAFEELIGLIFLQSTTTAQLYLYIDCEDEEQLSEQEIITEGFKNYKIKFRTNIFP